MTIDLRTFHNLKDATRVGDILYMPEAATRRELAVSYELLRRRLDRLPGRLAREIAEAPSWGIAHIDVEQAVKAYAERGRPLPDWVRELPAPYRRDASREYAIFALDDPNILPGFPYTGIGGYAVDLGPDGLLGEAYDRFGLGRLSGVRQLAWLTTPVLPEEQPDVIPTRFEHNRLTHVWDVAAIANLLATGLGLPKADARTLVLAAATHDARTPAGGDTTKLLDPAYFDEDARYPELLERDGMRDFLQRAGIDEGLLTRTVLGKGLLGELLDLADKTAYLSRDAYWFHKRFWSRVTDEESTIVDCDEGHMVHEILLEHGVHACAAWRSATVAGGRLAFTDPDALGRLLLLRALLFRALYFHPGSRFAEFVMSHVILRHLLETGAVRRETLLAWRDDRLDEEIKGYLHPSIGVYIGEPVHEGFDDEVAAEARAAALRAAGEVLVMVERLPRRIKSGTHFLVADGAGTPVPLTEAAPETAALIDVLAEVVHPFRLYWVPYETLAPKFRGLVERSLAAG